MCFSTPGHLISLAERGFARLSEAHLKLLGFDVGHFHDDCCTRAVPSDLVKRPYFYFH
ncbi:hypothetical protein FHS19_003366 [Paenibacillus rhizosphaerae]|uniref:Uncharacterized protein n=1 Tax=Paenibacillus rhizosphaerae TaxID=297318 RepID=A0A839TPR4_9BACL|nr:hypothetical protein [Paenibacillus rhizosphaerae]